MKHLGVVVAAAGLLSGCAFTDATISPAHRTAIVRTNPVAAKATSLFVGGAPPNGPPRAGVKKNGYGFETANILVTPAPEKIVGDALALELEHAGFKVDRDPPAPRIQVELNQFFTEPEVGFFAGDVYAVVDATVTVYLDSGRVVRRRFEGIGKDTVLFWTDDVFQTAFEAALNDFVMKAVPAIVDVLAAPASNGAST